MCQEVVRIAWDVHINGLVAFQLVQKEKIVHKKAFRIETTLAITNLN